MDVAHDLTVPGLEWNSHISIATWMITTLAIAAIVYFGWPRRSRERGVGLPAPPMNPQSYTAPGLRRARISIPTQQWAA